eukprot:6771457-Pyramimonas_sp.AAC.1
MRVQQLCWFAVLKSQKRPSVTIPDREDAAVRLIRGVEIPRTFFRHASRSSNGCLPTRQFTQWKCSAVGAYEGGTWREGSFQHR